MNNVVLIGRLTKDIELRYTANNKAFARFTIAVDKGLSKDKKAEAENKGQQTADFINIVVWGTQAENCQRYLQKGRNVAIQGSIQTGSYTAQDGTKRYTTDVLASRVQFIDWGNSQSQANNNSSNSDFGQFGDFGDFGNPTDEEIPF